MRSYDHEKLISFVTVPILFNVKLAYNSVKKNDDLMIFRMVMRRKQRTVLRLAIVVLCHSRFLQAMFNKQAVQLNFKAFFQEKKNT